METEEQGIYDRSFKLGFRLWKEGSQLLDVEQIKHLDKEFKKVEASLTESDS